MRGMREFYDEPEIFFNRVMDNGEIQIVSYGLDYIRSDKLLDDVWYNRIPKYIAERLLECRILGINYVPSLFQQEY